MDNPTKDETTMTETTDRRTDREHSVPSLCCRRPTWANNAECLPGQGCKRRATWGDVLIGDTLQLGHVDCIVRRVVDHDAEHVEITTDCGAGEHVMVVAREDKAR